jgi:hypothetical protein
MKRIEELLAKYWEVETSLPEEQELKDLLSRSEGYELEKEFFGEISQLASQEPKGLTFPIQTRKKSSWNLVKWAASLAIIGSSFYLWKVNEQKKAEREAFEQVMQAFALIQNNFAKGQTQMEALNGLRYLNTTHELFETNGNR